MSKSTKSICCICSLKLENKDLFPFIFLRNEAFELIKQDHQSINNEDFICFKDLEQYKLTIIKKLSSEKHVIDSFEYQEIISTNLNETYHEKRTFGEKLADKVAAFGGSWSFIISFALFMMAWTLLNSYKMLTSPFDPYPYILLNLILSCLAALQAPIIMMSQNRQEAKDRLRATHDYNVNLKAELEIRTLNSKLDEYIQASYNQLKALEKQQEKL